MKVIGWALLPALAAVLSCSQAVSEPPGVPGIGGAIILTNYTGHQVQYDLRRPEGADAEHMVLGPAESDRHTEARISITFMRGDRLVERTLLAGQWYAFRHNSKRQVGLFKQPSTYGSSQLAPFVATPTEVVRAMLELAAVTSTDVVYDIGCGDGRIVITAAQEFGARGVGIEIDGSLIERSRARSAAAGTERLVEFRHEDATRSDISAATVVAIYLMPRANEILTPLLEEQLRPGTRVVSHNYRIPAWEGRLRDDISVVDSRGSRHRIYLYRK